VIKPGSNPRGDSLGGVRVRLKTKVLDELRFEVGHDLRLSGAGLKHRHEWANQAFVLISRSVWTNTDRIPLVQQCIQFGIALSRFLLTKRHL
jgi:2,4-dienoyl-CoA reductase-like NADH-dependent reductase (Old Yellow Enzyme family)